MKQLHFIKAAELQEKLNAIDKIVATKTPRINIVLQHSSLEDSIFDELTEFKDDAETAFHDFLKKKHHDYSTQFEEL